MFIFSTVPLHILAGDLVPFHMFRLRVCRFYRSVLGAIQPGVKGLELETCHLLPSSPFIKHKTNFLLQRIRRTLKILPGYLRNVISAGEPLLIITDYTTFLKTEDYARYLILFFTQRA